MGTFQTNLRRLTWEVLPYEVRARVKSAVATGVGKIKHHRPVVEVFGNQTADFNHQRLRAELEGVDVSKRTDLCRIMTTYGSDKAMGRHNYTTVYRALFAELRSQRVNFFELGIGTNNPKLASTMGETGKPGASLRGWAEFFKVGRIVGADIDRAVLFTEGRITTFYCDQLNRTSINKLWENPSLSEEFDVVIEDGLHTFEANVSFLESSIHKVRRGGYYIIEDVREADLPRWREQLKTRYATSYSDFSFCLVNLPWLFNTSDNILLVARRN
jgi:hypothetical protein